MAGSKIPRQFGRQAFGGDAAGYHHARPPYPAWVYEMLCRECGLGQDVPTFEIGAGTGTATQRLLELGANPLVAIEPDQRLADFLHDNNPGTALRVVVAPFEDAILEAGAFAFGISATAFHWLDEDPALQKIADLLRPGGWWAAIWNVFGDDSLPDPFHDATKDLLGAPANPSVGRSGIPFALDTESRTAALKQSDAFDVIETKIGRWPLVLDAKQVMALYATYSNVIVRPDSEAVLAELSRIARNEFGNRVIRNMMTSVYIARRSERRASTGRSRR